MKKIKRLFMNKKVITSIGILIGIAIASLVIYGITYWINDFLNDYRCSTMPLSDFFQDKSCRKYWGLR